MNNRYSGQIAVPMIGEFGQNKLLISSVLIVGVGGLGCPIALQLVAAGLGTIGLVDGDIVSESNLARQILFSHQDVRKLKVEIASQLLQKMNPSAKIILHTCFLNEKNFLEIISGYEIVVDASDNFITRYLLNDACYFFKKPLVSGTVFRFEGRLLYFDFRKDSTPCLRCLHPTFDNRTQSCSTGGVTNMITGMIGSLQANEVLKCIVGISQYDETFLLKYDSMKNEMKKIKLMKDDECQLCSEKPLITEVKEMDSACVNNQEQVTKELTCTMEEFFKLRECDKKIVILDVRNPEELTIDGFISNNVNIPMDYLERDCEMKLDYQEEIIVYCRSGIRSLYATQILINLGFSNVRSLEGGILKYNEVLRKSSIDVNDIL